MGGHRGLALRNLVPVAGLVLSGWGAGEIVLLYYVDTLASLATVFALIMMYAKGMQVDASKPVDALNIALSTAFLTMSREMRRVPDCDARLKARFGFVFARWIAVFAACTMFPWPPLLVLTYVVASAWLEIRPLPPDPAP